MKKQFKVNIPIILILLGIVFIVMNNHFYNAPAQAEENEIMVHITLNLDEDIGLFLVDFDVNGHQGNGGMSNPDKSMINKDNSNDLYWSYYKEWLGHDADTVDMTLTFSATTKYFEPNYGNHYPAEYVVPMGTVSLKADFGKTYQIQITGNKTDGYRAFIYGPAGI